MSRPPTKEEREIMKKRFARMYPKNKPMTDGEAGLAICAVKTSGMWNKLLDEERQYYTSQHPKKG